VRVGINLEQLLFRTPGGIGRYTARLATLLPTLFPEDSYHGFVARHGRAEVAAAGLPLPTSVLALPRPVLYDSWHVLGAPRMSLMARDLAHLDVVHAPSVAVPPKGAAGLVVTVHDAAPMLFPDAFTGRGRWFHRRGLAAAARRADLVIAVSHAAAAELGAHAGIAAEKIRVVHNGVDTVEVSDADVVGVRRRHHLDDRPYVFWLGTQEPRKNVPLLVQAFAEAVATTGAPHALVLGGAAGWLHEHAASMPGADRLGDRLRVLGFVDDADLAAVYRGADLFAFPSLHEGFGIPILEAMAQGTPVVCTDIPALTEVAGGAAVLVPADVDAWAEALARMLTEEHARTALVPAGLARAKELTWERCARATRAVYEEAARG
jgi:glycosyltransferase involved in cell wall biosynthesis